MKILITNIYGTSDNNLCSLQHKVTEIARKIGFYELGIYRYPVETDSDAELQKRLDGICAAVEPGDKAVLQLPTGNGIEFEFKLISKLRGMGVQKIVLIVHDSYAYEDMSMLRGVERMIYPTERIGNDIAKKGLYAVRKFRMTFDSEDDSLVMRNLLKATDFYEEVFDKKGLSSEECIQIAFGLYDRTGKYTLLVGAVIQSVLENTMSKVCFHIFHDETLTEVNKEKLVQTVGGFGSYLQFHQLKSSDFEFDNPGVKSFTIGTMFRVVIPNVLKELDKIIYLDADLLLNCDVMTLWNIDISDYSLAAVWDSAFVEGVEMPRVVKEGFVLRERYFNAGVLLMNLNRIRERGDLLALTREFLEKYPDSILPDQDAFNYYFNDTTLLLDDNWNVNVLSDKEKNTTVRDDVLYHFQGQSVIDFFTTSDCEKLYLRTKAATPWRYEGIEEEIYIGYRSLSDKISCLQKLLGCIGGKKKIFYGYYKKQMQNLMDILGVGKEDYYVSSEEYQWGMTAGGLTCYSFEKLKQEKRGDYIVFVGPEYEGGHAIEKLEDLGLENQKDFFVIPRLLAGPQGGYWA